MREELTGTGPEESICHDCGLCCDGTIFAFVPLGNGDRPERLLDLGLNVQGKPGKAIFEQPCSCHMANRCLIYEARPAICREYRCALLKACDSGNTSREEAGSLIKETIELRDRVRSQVERFLGVERTIALPSLLRLMVDKLNKMNAEECKTLHAQMLLDVGALRVLLAKRFEPRDILQDNHTGADGSQKRPA